MPIAGDAARGRWSPSSSAATPTRGDAAEAVEEIRERLHELAPGGLLGGIPAENYDVEQTNARDTKLIVPLVLLVVGLILVAVLRALAAPAYLIATVARLLRRDPRPRHLRLHRASSATEGLAFNLVADGVHLPRRARGRLQHLPDDAGRARRRPRRGTREGVLAALVNTGGVVTGAGLILAGTFATLTLLPLEELVQIGATVAFGVLLDTFVVRALLIPAITYRLGDRAWWPSRVDRERRRRDRRAQ